MPKGFVFIFALMSSFNVSAARMHIFLEYSQPEKSLYGNERTRQNSFLKEILPKGIAGTMQPFQRIMIETSLFFPDFFRGTRIEKNNQLRSSALTGILSVEAKIILPKPKKLVHGTFYLQTGSWLLHHLAYRWSFKTPNTEPQKEPLSGYGWLIGGGCFFSLPSVKRCSFEVSGTYYIPTTLPKLIRNKLPENASQSNFFSIKVGLVWPMIK